MVDVIDWSLLDLNSSASTLSAIVATVPSLFELEPMSGALSPSLINLQAPFGSAGHLRAKQEIPKMKSVAASNGTASIHISNSNHSIITSGSPQKKQRSSSPTKPVSTRKPRKVGGSMKRTTSTASIMDTIMNSRAASDHDQPQLPTSSSNIFEYSRSSPFASSSQTTLADLESQQAVNVLLTPRRGRRVGHVDMGWGSPLPGESQENTPVPHTLPKPRRSQKTSLTSSPTKRKASTAFASELQESQRSLVDTAGWASAAMISSVPLSEKKRSVSPASPGKSTSPILASFVDTRDPFAAFTIEASPVVPQDPKLVPVEVEGLGRVAVHRDFVQQISDHGPVPSFLGERRLSTSSDRGFGLLRGSDSEDSSTQGSVGSSTDPTSVGTPCPSGVSPSFSLSSQFPASEPASPVKNSSRNGIARSSEDLAAEGQRALLALMHAPIVEAISTQQQNDNAQWRPRLGGSQNQSPSAKLPTLDWPDCPSGPWSAASKHVGDLRQKRREGIQRWLESDSSDESEASADRGSSSTYQHHPMVAKALLDRARKQQTPKAAVVSSATPSRRARKSKQLLAVPTPGKRRGRKPKGAASITSSGRKSVATGASLARSDRSAIFGCKCGIEDEAIIMVQCDSCRRWLHLPCVGIPSVQDLDDEWYCDDCCDAALTEHLSPASSLPTITSYADLSTPEGLQALLSGQEPVFTLPSGTPIHRRGVAMSSSIALAPSPPLLSVGDPNRAATKSTVKRQGQGRSRAERVGWRMNEPGSPLARKSTTASSGVRAAVPETPSKSSEATVDFTDASSTPSLLAGFSRADWEPVRTSKRTDRLTTPSPRLIGMSTPSRHASGRKASASGPLSLGLTDEEAAHAADLFSTPSRLASGGAWAYKGGAYSHAGSQTPSRSGGRHQRVDSFSGGLLTPSRDFLSGAFGTEPSTSMPSLVYSSGYIDGIDDHLGSGSDYSSNRAWQLQSPTASTRAVRARQTSGLGTPWSNSLLRTPELQPRQPNTSSIRGGRFDSSDDVPPSSSPFPRTPTFDVGSPRFLHPHHHHHQGHERHPSHLGMGLPSGGSSARLHRALEVGSKAPHIGERNVSMASASGAASKHRQVSTDLPMGLGIGLDLDDVLDWS